MHRQLDCQLFGDCRLYVSPQLAGDDPRAAFRLKGAARRSPPRMAGVRRCRPAGERYVACFTRGRTAGAGPPCGSRAPRGWPARGGAWRPAHTSLADNRRTLESADRLARPPAEPPVAHRAGHRFVADHRAVPPASSDRARWSHSTAGCAEPISPSSAYADAFLRGNPGDLLSLQAVLGHERLETTRLSLEGATLEQAAAAVARIDFVTPPEREIVSPDFVPAARSSNMPAPSGRSGGGGNRTRVHDRDEMGFSKLSLCSISPAVSAQAADERASPSFRVPRSRHRRSATQRAPC